MGVHLIIYKIKGKSTVTTWGGKALPYYDVEEVGWWDAIRYSGDRDFILSTEFDCVDNDNAVEDQEYFRPKDFDKTRQWVRDNIVEMNQHRILTALDKVQSDETLVFHWSW